MLNFIVRRIATGIVMLFAVSLVAYFFLYLGMGNVARLILGNTATEADVMAKNHELGIDQPFFVQYFRWISGAIHGDLGMAWSTPQNVSDALGPRLSVTLTIVLLTTIVAALLAIILGTLAAVFGGWIDRVVQVIGLVGFAVPGFLIAFTLITLFAVKLHLFNAVGYVQPTDNFGEWMRSITLPVIALSLSGIASVAQQVRGSVKDALNMDYVRTLRSRGHSFSRVIMKNVLRNAGGPALSILGVQFVGMMGGAVIVEQIFAIPGIGPFTVQATNVSDVPAVMGVVIVTALIVIVVNLIIDLLSAALNPKVRLA